jgi:hypothetical protein
LYQTLPSVSFIEFLMLVNGPSIVVTRQWISLADLGRLLLTAIAVIKVPWDEIEE